MTDTQRKAILGRLMDGAPRIVACHVAGLTRAEFAAHLGKNGALRDAVEETEAAAVAAVENALYKGAMRALEDPRYFRFMAFYLERKAGWVRPALENLHKSVQSVQPANLKPANPQPANQGKIVQSVQSTGDGAPASLTPAPVGARHAVPSPAVPNEKPYKTVQSVQSPGRSSVAFIPEDRTAVIPNLKSKIQETMAANRARAKNGR